MARERHGSGAILIGFSTFTGTVTAASDWDQPAERKRVRPALPGSFESLFHEVGIPDFLLPIRDNPTIAEILSPELIGTRLMAKVGKLASPEPIAVVEGMSVEKVGRGSGYTLGKAYDVSATLTLSYALGDLTFVDQILIRGASGAFSEDGDSGALVVDADSGRAAGLLIGGGGEFSIANHLEDVLTELGASLVV